jgi:hypothetical protein
VNKQATIRDPKNEFKKLRSGVFERGWPDAGHPVRRRRTKALLREKTLGSIGY